jgi:GH15 family glucan-1,4-alpha-glucosidase
VETGGIVAAATTSLPEQLGGPRNWDYRFCWLRDATLTLYAFLNSGFFEEAAAWRDWLLRAVAGAPAQMQIMYGIAGERRLIEYEVPWLKGYEGAAPVRIGNAAADQLQLDVFGEVLDSLYQARRMGLPANKAAWALERALVEHLEKIWEHPTKGFGRSAAAGASSPTPRSWRGLLSTARSGRSKSLGSTARLRDGGCTASGCMSRSAVKASTHS